MKKILPLLIVVATIGACNDQHDDATTVYKDTTVTVTSDVTSTDNTYVREEGDVMYRDGKVMVWRNNTYSEADQDITLDDNIVVKRNGEVTRDGAVRRLEEGEAVTRTGRFINKAGETVEDAWDATKEGVSKAADAVKKGVEKAGDKVNDAVN